MSDTTTLAKVENKRCQIFLIYRKLHATSAPSERLFSAAGHTITSEKSRLAPDLADAVY